jgi:tRNA-(ms[2]io[6]A)-hydroxylase
MLGLVVATDDRWIDAALADTDALLVDHAHCEMKAASNAMSLAVRYGERSSLVAAMIALAEEELVHFRRVHDMIVARGRTLGVPPVDTYAAELRKAAHGPRGTSLVDRLLVGALIEARSCERFSILAKRAPAPLDAFYEELLASEAGHYRTFVDLAVAEGERDGLDAAAVRARLRELAEREGEIVRRLADATSRGAIHG